MDGEVAMQQGKPFREREDLTGTLVERERAWRFRDITLSCFKQERGRYEASVARYSQNMAQSLRKIGAQLGETRVCLEQAGYTCSSVNISQSPA